jgi:integrase
MKRLIRVIKWAVAGAFMPTENYVAIKCVDPLKRGRTTAQEVEQVQPVAAQLVEATLPHLTQLVGDMVRFQSLTGCRPGEAVKITPGMVDRSSAVWTIALREHKTAYRGRERTLYVGPKAQKVLTPYLLRGADDPCFSPIESEQQRRQAAHERRAPPHHAPAEPTPDGEPGRKQAGGVWL